MNLATDNCTSGFAFGKHQRLLNSSDFQVVFDNAPVRTSHETFLFIARPNDLGFPRLGLVIAKKHIRFAVGRNRVKRLIRETFRAQQHDLPGLDIVVLAKKGMGLVPNEQLIELLNQQWDKLRCRAQRLNTSTN